jgi:aldehyde dehydrogenase (NAD+)
LVDAGLPAGVLNLVLGRGSVVGDVLTRHPRVRAISFTGSTPVGRAIERGAVPLGKKVQLEMGGKNPAVVLADADLDLASQAVGRAAFLSAGQKCTATSRVIIEQAVFDDFAERISEVARTWRVGDPLDERTKVGPLSSKEQLDTVLQYLAIANADGGTTRVGGQRLSELGDGYYVPPTVFTGLPPSSRVSVEEIFGPVVTLIPATSYEEAVGLANDTPFGLSASLFTRDLDKAFRFARDSDTGIVKVNQESTNMEIHTPFGGLKDSSAGGREQGKAARHFFTESKTIYITHGGGGLS